MLDKVPAETVTDATELFTALFETPLAQLPEPETSQLIIIDALDELPKQGQKLLLALIAGQLAKLPSWLKLFVTSREEPQIKTALSKFKPKELRADEKNNKADVEIYLRSMAAEHVKGDVSMADLEADVSKQLRRLKECNTTLYEQPQLLHELPALEALSYFGKCWRGVWRDFVANSMPYVCCNSFTRGMTRSTASTKGDTVVSCEPMCIWIPLI